MISIGTRLFDIHKAREAITLRIKLRRDLGKIITFQSVFVISEKKIVLFGFRFLSTQRTQSNDKESTKKIQLVHTSLKALCR